MTAINSNRAIRGPVTAVPVVAGKGVKLVADTENNRWVVEADETVLWENTNGTAPSSFPVTLSETTANFERVRFYFRPWSTNDCVLEKPGNQTTFLLDSIWTGGGDTSVPYHFLDILTLSGTSLNFSRGIFMLWTNTTLNSDTVQFRLYKVVGVNRIASN